jgi:hypothetical protein
MPEIIIRRVFLLGKPDPEIRVLPDPSSGMAAARAAEASSWPAQCIVGVTAGDTLFFGT